MGWGSLRCNRITGAALYFGIILLIWWLLAAAISADYFAMVQAFFGHPIGKLILFGFTWALLHHTLGGLRHLLWDTGRGFDLKTTEWMARANLALSILGTLALWLAVYLVRGTL
jgi:succinate dehydrogenase / fumarate reductase cytochrome b subunit